MSDIKELKDEELEKVAGGYATELVLTGEIYVHPSVYGRTVDGVTLSFAHCYGGLFDENGVEYCWTSFQNNSANSTTLFFTKRGGLLYRQKEVTSTDDIIPFLYSEGYISQM